MEGVQKEARIMNSRLRSISITTGVIVFTGLILFSFFKQRRISSELISIEKSIAVLPFDILSADVSQLWFTEGISDLIISQLNRISNFRVISRTSSEKYRETKKSVQEIGHELGVNFIIDGTVQKRGDRVQIIPKLIRVENEAQLWSEVYDNNWDEIIKVQADIANKVASNLLTALSPAETERIDHVGTENTDAWEYYIRGNSLMQKYGEANFWKAIDNYKKAIALDPDFAEACAGLALAYFELTMWDVPEPDPAFIPVARKWAFKALELNENLGEPHFILGAISYHHDWDWHSAESAFKTGMELDPNYIMGRNYYSSFLYTMRRFEEAITISENSQKLDPLNPGVYIELGCPLWYAGQKERAYELYLKCQELYPDSWNIRRLLSIYYLEKGINQEFVLDFCQKELERFDNDYKKTPAFKLGDIGYLFVQSGHKKEAIRILNELKRRIDEGEEDISYMWMGFIYYRMGDTEKAIDFLEEGYEVKEPFLFIINVIPEFDDNELRTNKRFQVLLKKLGFET